MANIIDPNGVAEAVGSSYPDPFRASTEGRRVRRLTDPLGLINFAVNVVTLDPGAASSQRHWHTRQDEFVQVMEGRITLVSDEGEQILEPGMMAAFPAGDGNGHTLVNNTDAPVVFLVVGDRAPGDQCHYPDIDLHMKVAAGGPGFYRKNGEAY